MKRATRRAVLGAALVAAGPVRTQDPDVRLLHGAFATRGGDRRVVVVEPPTPVDATLILLHGSGGLQSALPVFVDNARRLAKRGFRTVMPSYFSDAYDAAEADDPADWPLAVRDAVDWSLRLSGADAARVVGMGYSLGGHLIVQGAVTDLALAAAVGVASAGALAPGAVRRRPPVRLIHAEGDPVVRAGRVRRWADRLRRDDVPVTVRALPVARHAFEDDEWRDVFDDAAGFFQRALQASA